MQANKWSKQNTSRTPKSKNGKKDVKKEKTQPAPQQAKAHQSKIKAQKTRISCLCRAPQVTAGQKRLKNGQKTSKNRARIPATEQIIKWAKQNSKEPKPNVCAEHLNAQLKKKR